MEAGQPTRQQRKRLRALLANDRPDPARLLARLREFRRLEDIPACSAALGILAHLELEEPEAERLMAELLEHRSRLETQLGRDPGLRVAAIDYLANIRKLMQQPTIVEQALLERTERSAITDDLTGLYNRRYFQTALDMEVRRSRRYGLALSLLMLDLDAFKPVNDHYGHPFGDLVLQLAARVLRRAIRESDQACRIGGDELVVILPDTDRLGGFAVAERVRQQVEREFNERPIGNRALELTVSGGVAAYPEDGNDGAALIARADEALYQAKARGRNRIVIFHAEQRRAVRYPVRPRARCRVVHSGSGAAWEAVPLNLSQTGALVELPEGPRAQDVVEMILERRGPAAEAASWAVVGRVVRVEAGTRAGRRQVAIAFDEPLPEQCLKLHVRKTRLVRPVARGLA